MDTVWSSGGGSSGQHGNLLLVRGWLDIGLEISCGRRPNCSESSRKMLSLCLLPRNHNSPVPVFFLPDDQGIGLTIA